MSSGLSIYLFDGSKQLVIYWNYMLW